jgi:hypothetical protein
MSDEVTKMEDRDLQRVARMELCAVGVAYLATEDRDPEIAEQIVRAMIEYLDGEERVGL